MLGEGNLAKYLKIPSILYISYATSRINSKAMATRMFIAELCIRVLKTGNANV